MTPAPPPGFELEDQKLPALPPGFELEGASPQMSEANKALTGTGLSVSQPKPPPVPAGLANKPDPAYMNPAFNYADRIGRRIGAGIATMSDPSMERKAHGAHEIASGVAQSVAPGVLPLAVMNPVSTAVGLGVGYGAQKGASEGARNLGLGEGYSELAGDVAGAGFGGAAAKGASKLDFWPQLPGLDKIGTYLADKGARFLSKKAFPGGGQAYDWAKGMIQGEEAPAAASLRAPKEAVAKPTRSGNRVPDPAPVQPTPQPIRSGNRIPDPPPAAAPIPVMRSGNRVPDVPPAPAQIQPVRSGNRVPDAPPATPIAQTLPPVPSNNRVPTMVPEPPPPVEVIPTPTRSGNRTPDVTKPVVKPIPAEPTPGPGSVRGKGVSPTWSSGTGPTPTEAAPTPAASPNRPAPTTPIPTEKVTKPDAAKAAQDLADEMGVTTIEPTSAARVRVDKRAITTVNSVNKQIRDAGVKGAKELTLDEFKNMSPKEQKAIMDRLNEIKGLAEGGVVDSAQSQRPKVKVKQGRRSKRGLWYGPPPVTGMRK